MKLSYNIKLPDIKTAAWGISKQLKGGEVFALIGPLGSGKTAFARALGKQLKVRQKMTSPTFTLLHIFPAILGQKKHAVTLFHLDLYRLKNFREVKTLGLPEIWGKKNTVTLIEWANKIKKYLPKKTIFLHFSHG